MWPETVTHSPVMVGGAAGRDRGVATAINSANEKHHCASFRPMGFFDMSFLLFFLRIIARQIGAPDQRGAGLSENPTAFGW